MPPENAVVARSDGEEEGMRVALHATVEDLHQKYAAEPHILSKLNQYVTSTLPGLLESHRQAIHVREKTKQKENDFKAGLVRRFMTSSDYYYSPATESYFAYDGRTYVPIAHDSITQHIYQMLTQNNVIVSLKYKVMRLIMKRVKERTLTNAIPESATIQSVLSLFSLDERATKNAVKYFLAIIGDVILKKNAHLCYFLSPRMKPCIRELTNKCYEHLGCDMSSLKRLKYKFSHDHHAMSDCRLLMQMRVSDANLETVRARALDLICVATHYSSRYKSGEDFLASKSFDRDLVEYACYVKDKAEPDAVVRAFIDDSLEVATDKATTLTTKNMVYLWKRFCERRSIPSVVYLGQLPHYLAQHFDYDAHTETFACVTSTHMPIVRAFIRFWTECATPVHGESEFVVPLVSDSQRRIERFTNPNTQIDHEDIQEYETEEVCAMFKSWSVSAVCPPASLPSLNESLLLKLIRHFYEDSVTVEADKYIYGVTFKMWDKPDEVVRALRHFYAAMGVQVPISAPAASECQHAVSTLYDVYSEYEKYRTKNIAEGLSEGMTVSKRYFEKCARAIYPNAIEENEENEQRIRLVNWSAFPANFYAPEVED